MSAIFGLLHRDGKPVDPEDLHRMSEVLAPHGPDDQGLTIQGHLGLGCRLRRFTPEDRYEAQPLFDGRRVFLVSDARIDNRKELQNELGIGSPEAAGMADSAFILRAWQRWGAEFPAHLIGAFSFALYDASNQTLILSRSPRGERPLLYVMTPGVFAFSTAPKGLFALPFIKREINFSRVADFLLMKPYDQDSTFYAGIGMLRPGHTMLVRRDSAETRRFWHLERLPETRFQRDAEYVEAFSDLFDRVVEDSLRSVSPVGIMLSGGLDSTSVAASAALALSKTGGQLSAFTEIPEDAANLPVVHGRYPDETPFVEAMSLRYPNIDTNYIRTPGGFFLHGIKSFFEAAEVPFRNASNRVWIEEIKSQASQCGIRVLLTGGAGNVTTSWNGSQLLPQLIGQGRWYRALIEARNVAKAGGSSSTVRTLTSGLIPLLPNPIRNCVQRLRHPFEPLSKTPWKKYSCIGPALFSDQNLSEKSRGDEHSWKARLRIGPRLPVIERRDLGAEIARGHEAMFGVQTRDPTDDQRIIEFCLSIPEDQFLRDGMDRWLIRRALSDRAPDEILHNKRRGLQVSDWLNRLIEARSEVMDELALQESSELARYAIDLREMRRLVGSIPSDVTQAGPETLSLRAKLEIGLMTGRFLRWVDSGE